MRAANWIREARRRCSSDLFICRNKLQARMVGVHPECLQVWDRAPMTYEPYFVLAIHQSGLPRDPYDYDISVLQGMSSDREHQGRKGWIDDLDRGARARYDRAEEDYARRVKEWFSSGGEGHSRALWGTKNKLVIAQTIPKNQGNNMRRRRPR